MTDATILSFTDARSRRPGRALAAVSTPPYNTGSVNIFTPDDDSDITPSLPRHLQTDYILLMARDHDESLFRNFGPAFFGRDNVPDFETLDGIKMLRGRPIFAFMQAVWSEDLMRMFRLWRDMGPQIRDEINVPNFFYTTGSSDVSFVTPSHLVRSLTMAKALKDHFGARFDIPDSEGYLPQSHWARHATDPVLFPYGEMYLNMDMRRGGQDCAIAHEAPIWEAFETENIIAAQGLGVCETGGVNTPRGHITPLFLAATQASERLYHRETPRLIGRSLKFTWNLARSPNVDWARMDFENHTVMDMPLHKTVGRLLQSARAKPLQVCNL